MNIQSSRVNDKICGMPNLIKTVTPGPTELTLTS